MLDNENVKTLQEENGTEEKTNKYSCTNTVSVATPNTGDAEAQDKSGGNRVYYAGFFPRLTAHIIDCALASIPAVILSAVQLAWAIQSDSNVLSAPFFFSFSVMDILKYLLFTAYFIVLTGLTGTTAGKRAMRLCVVAEAGKKPDWLTVVYRETIGRYLTSILWLGYFVLAFDKQHRGFHDMLCDTRVIYALQ